MTERYSSPRRTRTVLGCVPGRVFSWALAGLLLTAAAPAATPAPPASSAAAEDPYTAYEAGAYDQAVQGFTDARVEEPGDPALLMNLGSALYKVEDYKRAEAAFTSAASAAQGAEAGKRKADKALAAKAYYNLGNVAYRQDRLDEAVERYRRALEIDPTDQDAKFNLEFTRREIERRQQEQKQQDQQQGDNQDQNQEKQPQDQQQQDQQSENPEPSPNEEDAQQQEQQGDSQQGQTQQESENSDNQQGGQDQDGDGLSDSTERGGENPTDPTDPDSDRDGLSDGQEDANHNGRTDPGETDPNNPDSDGDGLPDRQDPQPTEAGEQPPGADQPGEMQPGQMQPGTLTPEEAARYLALLEEGRPDLKRRAKEGRSSRPAKDW